MQKENALQNRRAPFAKLFPARGEKRSDQKLHLDFELLQREQRVSHVSGYNDNQNHFTPYALPASGLRHPLSGARLSLPVRAVVRILIFRSALCAPLRINHKNYAYAYKNIRRGESRKP